MKSEMLELENFPARLRICVKRVGALYKMAELSGISKTSISQYLNGSSEPSISKALKIASLSNVSVEWLITGHGAIETAEEMQNAKGEQLDLELMKGIIEAIENSLIERGAAGKIDPRAKADLIASTYLSAIGPMKQSDLHTSDTKDN